MLDNMSNSDTSQASFAPTAQANLVDPALLEKIDKLFACGVGYEVDLPQLVVVGQQSSGKSSVLEGLTGLPFPRDKELCTRFATQITFRRAPTSSVRASIIPGAASDEEHRAEVEGWKKSLDGLDPATFSQIMVEVKGVIGLDQIAEDDITPLPAFSTDILLLEVMGPNEEHFSIIDVPGIFSVTAPGVTTAQDITLVNDMVEGYMYNPRSIMLVVVTANVDLAIQEIVQKASDIDPSGERTLGILTKPDLIDKGAEDPVVEILENRKKPLKLGWHMLRNPGQAELDTGRDAKRTSEIQFFRTEAPWRTMNKDFVGVQSLKVRLQTILGDHLAREFPNVQSEIEAKLAGVEAELKHLGPKRDTPLEHMQYLLQLAQDYRDVSEAAGRGDYAHNKLLDDKEFRLATLVMSRSDDFSNQMALRGHEYAWRESQTTTASPSSAVGSPKATNAAQGSSSTIFGAKLNPGFSIGSSTTSPLDVKGSQIGFGSAQPLTSGFTFEVNSSRPISAVPTPKTAPTEATTKAAKAITEPKQETRQFAIARSLSLPFPHFIGAAFPRNGIDLWLEELYHSSRGYELGSFPTQLVGMMMKVQARKWEELAMAHTSDIICVVHRTIVDLIGKLAATPLIQYELLTSLKTDLEKGYRAAVEHTRFLLQVELDGEPATHNHYFNEELQKHRIKRFKAAQATKDPNTGQLVDHLVTHMSNTKYTIRELHDILEAYYKVARKRFVDNVRMHVVDWFLVKGPTSPLKYFSPTFVSKLDAKQLDRIVGEEPATRMKRHRLVKQIKSLKEGKQFLES